jgi:hypothetical protein
MTQTFIGTLYVQTCLKCGMAFGIEKSFDEARRNDHQFFYCPAGHAQYYSGKSEAEQLKQEIVQLNQSLTYTRKANNSLHTQITEKNHSIRSLKGAKTRLMNRVKNGVCPCCNRHFSDLERHMKSKHPEQIV